VWRRKTEKKAQIIKTWNEGEGGKETVIHNLSGGQSIENKAANLHRSHFDNGSRMKGTTLERPREKQVIGGDKKIKMSYLTPVLSSPDGNGRHQFKGSAGR